MRKIIAAAAVALALAAPGAAMAFPHGPHFGGWGFHHGWGWGAVGLGVGLGALAVEEESCWRDQPIYNRYGEYVGSRSVNVCY